MIDYNLDRRDVVLSNYSLSDSFVRIYYNPGGDLWSPEAHYDIVNFGNTSKIAKVETMMASI